MNYSRYRNYDPFKTNPGNIDALSLGLVTKKSKVLELGCGDGRLTEYLSKKLHCRVITAEKIRANAENARASAQTVITGDIEDKQIQKLIKKHGPYDIVYASAVIGSLIDPGKLLLEIKAWLKKDGFLVITFPNILHLSKRLNFFSGKFNYEQSGLCSAEHLHFYSIHSAEELILHAGYRIIKKDYDLVGFPRIEKMLYFIPRFVFRNFYKFLPGLFTYQTVFKAQPHEK